jgi:uncharacterized membrane protein
MQIHQKLYSRSWVQAILFIVIIELTGRAYAGTCSLPPMAPARYQFTYIEIPGNTFIAPFTPTGQGVTAGFYNDDQGGQHGFLWENGQVFYLITPNGNSFTPASGLNGHGEVVGSIIDSDGKAHAYVYATQDGTWTTLPDLPGLPGLGNESINNAGIVVGSEGPPTQGNVGYIWDGKTYSFFSVPGVDIMTGIGTFPMGVNNKGQICGQYSDHQGRIHGFIKDGASYATVDVPGADQTWCIAMNNQGDVVGVYYVFGDNFQEQGYLLHDGQFYTFRTPGYGALTGINDQGVVTGAYTDSSNGLWHGFIATPHGKP